MTETKPTPTRNCAMNANGAAGHNKMWPKGRHHPAQRRSLGARSHGARTAFPPEVERGVREKAPMNSAWFQNARQLLPFFEESSTTQERMQQLSLKHVRLFGMSPTDAISFSPGVRRCWASCVLRSGNKRIPSIAISQPQAISGLRWHWENPAGCRICLSLP